MYKEKAVWLLKPVNGLAGLWRNKQTERRCQFGCARTCVDLNAVAYCTVVLAGECMAAFASRDWAISPRSEPHPA